MENNKRLLSALSDEELKALFAKNNHLQEVMYNYGNEDASIYFDDIASVFSYTDYRTGKKETRRSAFFECDSYGRYYVTIKDEEEFLTACNNLQKDYCFINDQAAAALIPRLLSKVAFYEDCCCGYEDISESRFEKLEKWMQAGLDKIKNMLAYYLRENIEGYTDFNYLQEEFVYQVKENNNFCDYMTDGEKVFYTVNYCKS